MKLTVRQAAKLLSVSESEVYRWVESGEIPCVLREEPAALRSRRAARMGDGAPAAGIARAVREQRRGWGSPSLRRRPRTRRRPPRRPRPGPRRRSCARLSSGSRSPKRTIGSCSLQILLARESAGSSGIGDGIAIPHVRSPLIFPGTPGIATLSYLAAPVPFDADRRQAGSHGVHARQPDDPRTPPAPRPAVGGAARSRLQGSAAQARGGRGDRRRGAARGGGARAEARTGRVSSCSGRWVGRRMTLLLVALGVSTGTGVFALAASRWPRARRRRGRAGRRRRGGSRHRTRARLASRRADHDSRLLRGRSPRAPSSSASIR